MKGIFSISQTFMNILITGYIAVVLLGVFFSINQYHLISLENRLEREALIIGDSILTSCLVEESNWFPVKGLFSEYKIEEEETINPSRHMNIHCMNYGKSIYVEIYDLSGNLLHGIGNSKVCEEAFPRPCKKLSTTTNVTFPASLKQNTRVIPVNAKIYLGPT